MPVNVCSTPCPDSLVDCTPTNDVDGCASVDVLAASVSESLVGTPGNVVSAFGDPICH